MAEMLIQSENLVSIADEVRELSDTTDKMSLSAMTSNLQEANADVNTETDLIAQIQSALEGKAGGGGSVDYSAEDGLITGMLSGTYENSRVTKIGNYAFYSCTSLTSVSFSACTIIGNNAFSNCLSLTSVNFPVCTSIGSYAFYYCNNLISISFPSCTNIGTWTFFSCSKLTSVNFPVCTSIGNSAFQYCSSLTSVNFPVCTNIGNSAFYNCFSLASVNFPACTSIGNGAFTNCTSLTSANFPACIDIWYSAFRNCRTLSSLTLGAVTVCTLENSNAFTSTPYVGYSSYFSGTPYIYVPGYLLSSYQTATNWTYFSSYFSAIPGTDNPPLITFSIDGVEYQAIAGMTFIQWANSSYNTDGFTTNGSWECLVTPSGEYILVGYLFTVIEANKAY